MKKVKAVLKKLGINVDAKLTKKLLESNGSISKKNFEKIFKKSVS